MGKGQNWAGKVEASHNLTENIHSNLVLALSEVMERLWGSSLEPRNPTQHDTQGIIILADT